MGADQPNEVLLAEGFRTKTLLNLFKTTDRQLKDEQNRREVLSSQYIADILGESRIGYGAITTDRRSGLGCLVLDQDIEPHQKSIKLATSAREFQFGDRTTKFSTFDTATAFRNLQREKCGIIYGNHVALRDLLVAAKRINFTITALPIWASQKSIESEVERILADKTGKQQSEAERIAELRRRLVEEKARKQQETNALSNRQREYRKQFGPKVASIVSGIETQISDIRIKIEASINSQHSLGDAVKGYGFFGEFPQWYGKKIQGGWVFDSIIATAEDYGNASWRKRDVKAIVASVRILMKNHNLGEYSDDCWYVGYIIDSEFSMQREPTISTCMNNDIHKRWQINHRFETRWKLVSDN